MTHTVRKRIGEVINYSVDFNPGMDADETIITSSPWWTVDGGSPLVINSQVIVNGEAIVNLGGGPNEKVGNKYKAYVQVGTSKQQTLIDSLTVEIISN